MRRWLMAGCSVLALAACSERPLTSEFDGAAFGAATMNNVGIQTGEIRYLMDMGQRFAREVPDTVNFDFDSARLDAQARAALDRQANWIRQFPEVRFRVYGHTDLVGSAAYNHRLGQRRAAAVVDYLVSRGIGRNRLEAVVSHGETRPLIQTHDPERRNRRTVTEVSGFLENHPAVLNGEYAAIVFREYVASATRRSR